MSKHTILIALFLVIPYVTFSQNQHEAWTFQTNGRIYSSAAIKGNLVYFGSGDSTLYAVNKNSGALKWKFKTLGAVQSNPAINKGFVYFGSQDGKLYSLDAQTGKLIWKFQSKGERMLDVWDYYLSSPTIENGVVYWGSGDGNMYALNAKDGKPIWNFHAGAIIHATPLLSNGKVYFGDYNGKFYALDADNGALFWQFKTVGDTYFPKGEIPKGAAIDNGVIYFGSRDFNLYAIDAETGTGRWNRKELGSWIIAEPLIYKDKVYFGTSDTHRFYCLDKTNGNSVWQLELPMRVYGSAITHNNLIYFGCFDGKIRAVDAQTGEEKWEFQTAGSKKNYSKIYNAEGKFKDGFELYGKDYLETEKLIHTLGSILSTPIIDSNTIYFGSSDGNFYAIPTQ